MSVWNFGGLQKRLKNLAVKGADGETLYTQAAIDMLLDVLARSIPVDRDFYLSNHPDLSEAHGAGRLPNIAVHFIEHGFYEDRLPSRPIVDEMTYMVTYPDVAVGVKNGIIQSATEHWLEFGRFEDREAFLYCDKPRGTR